MYLRFLYLKINPEYQALLVPFFNQRVIPELQQTTGCLFAGLVKGNQNLEDHISITLWKSKDQAEAFDQSESYKKLLNQIHPYLSESNEWKIQLSENLELQYDSVSQEPVRRDYRVTAEQAPADLELFEKGNQLYVRLVSLKLQPGRVEEFRQIYRQEIVPVLQKYKGCRYIYLSENLQDENEIISITVWDSKVDADKYEKSGEFNELVIKVKHTLSHFYQWQMQLAQEQKGEVRTSEDMKVDYYRLVSGKRFS